MIFGAAMTKNLFFGVLIVPPLREDIIEKSFCTLAFFRIKFFNYVRVFK